MSSSVIAFNGREKLPALIASTDLDVRTKYQLDYKLAELKTELVKWAVGLALAQSGLLVAILLKLT